MLLKFISFFFMLFCYKLEIHGNVPHNTSLPKQVAIIHSNNSLNLAQIMSLKRFLKTPSTKPIWTVELYSQPPVLKQDKYSTTTYSAP